MTTRLCHVDSYMFGSSHINCRHKYCNAKSKSLLGFLLAVRSINARKPAASRAGREAPTPPAMTPVVGGRFTKALSQRLRAKVRKTLTSYSVGQREEHPNGSCSVLTRRTRRTSTSTGTQTTLQSLVLFHLMNH